MVELPIQPRRRGVQVPLAPCTYCSQATMGSCMTNIGHFRTGVDALRLKGHGRPSAALAPAHRLRAGRPGTSGARCWRRTGFGRRHSSWPPAMLLDAIQGLCANVALLPMPCHAMCRYHGPWPRTMLSRPAPKATQRCRPYWALKASVPHGPKNAYYVEASWIGDCRCTSSRQLQDLRLSRSLLRI